MAAHSPDYKGIYLYAVVAWAGGQNLEIPGIDKGVVYTLSEGKISAVVSDVSNKKLRPERRHLAAHQGVLRRLVEEGTPLPMTFGIIADGPQAIRRILTLNQESFQEALDHVNAKVEMGLRVTWDVPNIFDYFISKHPELRTVRDRYFVANREPAHEEKLALGRMFDNLLNEEREIHTETVEEILSSACFEIIRNPCRSELEVMSLACLVGRDKADQKAFEKGILKAANLFDNNYSFDYNGPWAPHNFVAIDLKL
ncbi:MAG: GvpL/GvpF family gas vesicle protein [Pseudomonadota bacterium]